MTIDDFLSQVLAIEALKPDYKLGHSGADGYCDCIGLIIGAIRRTGGSWTGTHGSNWAARFEVEGLRAVASAKELNRGDVVFKAYEKGGGKWDLPGSYQEGGSRFTGDVRDYYHVGVVYSAEPLVIIHCTGPGVIRDGKLGKWGFAARSKRLNGTSDQTGGESSMVASKQSMAVVSGNGEPVRWWVSPSKDGETMGKLFVGTAVEQLETDGAWSKISYEGKTGYMMCEFLKATREVETVTRAEFDEVLRRLAEVEKMVQSVG